MLSRRRTTTVVFLVVVVTVLVGSSSAFAASPWWHLTSGSRPTTIQPGSAKAEVQEITAAPNTTFALQVQNTAVGIVTSEPFESEPYSFGNFKHATAANVQTALESAYGAGNVHVTGMGPAGEPEKQVPPLTVTSVGEDAQRAVPPLEIVQAEGAVKAKVVSRGRPDGEIVVTAENVGDATVNGGTTPVQIADTLPSGLKAVGIAGTMPFANGHPALPCSLKLLTCTLTGALVPYAEIEVRIAVVVEGASSGQTNQATISGGEAPSAVISRPLTISSVPTPFGVENYELTHEEEGGAPDTQAGSHPFQQTTTLNLNQTADSTALSEVPDAAPAALAKDLNFKWPPGLIGNPTVFPRCTIGQFLTQIEALEGLANQCSLQAAVGVVVVTLREPGAFGALTFVEPLFNLEPRVGEPARLGFLVPDAHAPVFINASVRTGGDYGITVSSSNITQTAGFLSAQVTVWGVPGDPRHDKERGYGCLYKARGLETICNLLGEQHPSPFLSLPTSCTSAWQTSVEADSWLQAGAFQALSGGLVPAALDGCNHLPFSAEIKVVPDGHSASTPTGLTVDVHVPQDASLNPAGLANSNIKAIKVTLPEDVVLNPAAADGLQACSETLIGFTGFREFEPGTQTLTFTEQLPEPLEQGLNFCPDASKVGTVKIKTPLLPNPLEGAVYLAAPAPNEEEGQNPFRALVAMYIVAKDPVSGALVKLPGKVTLNQETGRIESTFEDTPQLAFEDAELHFFGGDRAPLATPARCGTYTTEATFTPWSGNPPIKSQSSFEVTTGPNGSPCPGALPFGPFLAAGSPNINAGAFSPLTTTISRADGNQNIQTVQLHMAPGMSGILAGIPLCPEAQANAGACGPESLIGETIVSVGLGGDPFTVTGGKVYLTEKYQGAPFGLSIVNPADAGPFHLGKVIVRAKIEIDPSTAALTITTDPSGPHAIPHIIDGFPLQVKHVNVLVNRPGFTFNPTDCNPMSITGTIGSVEGASAPVLMPFQVTNCAVLKFAPKFSVSTSGKTSKANGASLSVKLAYPSAPFGSQANIAKVKVDLPKLLPSRLTTLQKACTAAQFNANPAGCPQASIIGHVKVITPLLPVPLTGPAIFVSHGGEAFPSLTMVLQGYGVTVDLVGSTFINKQSITSTTFKTVPDVPFNTFELTLPQGRYSALAANGNLCKSKLKMPTAFVAQNGLTIHQSTPIKVTGCAKSKKAKRKHRKARSGGRARGRRK
jgi:hypothetical protein